MGGSHGDPDAAKGATSALDSFGVLRPFGAAPLYLYRNGPGKVSPTMQSGARNLLSGSARCQRRRRAAFPTGQCVAQRKVGTCHVLHASSNSPVRRQWMQNHRYPQPHLLRPGTIGKEPAAGFLGTRRGARLLLFVTLKERLPDADLASNCRTI